MDGLICLAVGVTLALPVVAFVIALRALARAREAERRTGRVIELERELELLRVEMRAMSAPLAPEPRPIAFEAARPLDVAPLASLAPLAPLGSGETPPPLEMRPPEPAPPELPPIEAPPPFEPAPPAEPVEAPARAPEVRRVEWERLLGVRGAAVAGGVVLALAAILFFRHAFAVGWIGPRSRVGMGLAGGALAILIGGRLRRREYRFAPEALQGAGIVALYAAIWAAHKLYFLVSLPVAFPAMAAVTVLAGVLAHKNRAALTAVLGLLGGFATPLLLASDQDRPIGLFGYVLLLDAGLVYVASRRRWPWLALLGLGGTALMQGLWIVERMGPERLPLALGILGVFALLFAASARMAPADERGSWVPAQSGGVLVPFLFAFYLAARADLGGHLYPIALLAGLLGAAASWIARDFAARWLPCATAAGTSALALVWFAARDEPRASELWELALVSVGLGAVYLFVAELRVRAGASRTAFASVVAAAVSTASLLAVALLATAHDAPVELWPRLAALAPLAAMVLRTGALAARASADEAGSAPVSSGPSGPFGSFLIRALPMWAALALALGLALYQREHMGAPADPHPNPRLLCCLLLGLGAGLSLVASRARSEPLRSWTWRAAGLFALLTGLSLLSDYWMELHAPELFLLVTLALGLLVAATSMALASPWWLALALCAVWLEHAVGAVIGSWLVMGDAQVLRTLLLLLAAALAFGWLPLVCRARTCRSSWFDAVGTFAWPLWYFLASELFDERFGPDLPSAPALALALAAFVPILAALRARYGGGPGASHATSHAAAHATAALALVAIGAARQIEIEPVPVALALWAVGLARLGRWSDLGSVRRAAGVAGAFAALMLAVYSVSPRYFERSEALVVNELSYVYLLPAAALLVGAAAARGSLASGKPHRAVPAVLGLGGLALIFFWINLEILNGFSHDEFLAYRFERVPARDLTTSLAWAAYAFLLLAIGMLRRVGPLRWASLALLLLTLLKVFLYDLGELEGLYRVGSLLGLALALIAVSLLYQRFVFRRAPQPAATAPA